MAESRNRTGSGIIDESSGESPFLGDSPDFDNSVSGAVKEDWEDDALGDEDDDTPLDFASISDKVEYALWPSGKYPGRFVEGELGSSQAGNRMITWQIKAYSPDDPKPKTLFHYSVLTPENLPRLKRLISRVAPEHKNSKLSPRRIIEILTGRDCTLRVGNKEYDNTKFNRIRDILPVEENADSFLS